MKKTKKVNKTNKPKIMKLKPEQYFYVCSGSVVKNVKELAKAIKNMDENTFRNHVNQEKNDFANWMKDTLNENKLAEEITKTTDKNQTELLLLRSIHY